MALSTLVELASEPSGQRSVVLHLTQAVRAAILRGRLVGGMHLPSNRVLAKATGRGRRTVVEAIEQLAMEGYPQTRQGAHTRVAIMEAQRTTQPASVPFEPARWASSCWRMLSAWGAGQ